MKQAKETHLLPLVVDLTNPSPAIGWQNAERGALADRGPAGLVLALALVHHLAIANNVPLPDLAAFFARVSRRLVIEFVPNPIRRSSACWPPARISFLITMKPGSKPPSARCSSSTSVCAFTARNAPCTGWKKLAETLMLLASALWQAEVGKWWDALLIAPASNPGFSTH